MPQAFVGAPIILAAVLILAAAAKWRQRESLLSSVRLLRLPGWLQGPVRFLPPVELALAVGLLVLPWWQAFVAVALATLGLMLAYTAVIARGLTLTPRPSCGCFGRVGAPITPETLIRNIALTLLAVAALAWGLAGHAVPPALLDGGTGVWAWLLMLVAAAAVARWVVLDRSSAGEESQHSPHDAGLTLVQRRDPRPSPAGAGDETPSSDNAADAAADGDYVREPIPPLLLLDGERPTTLARLASTRATLLVWVTCACSRSHTAVARADAWRDAMPLVDVRLVSTMAADQTHHSFEGNRDWLFDLDGQALRALGIASDPAALLLGADGMLAGGPVAGLDDVVDFGEQIREQVAGAAPSATADATD